MLKSLNVPKYIPYLNGIRAFSVLIVVIAHSGFGHIVPGGFGVTVFFFLSGYLITTLLFVEFENSNSISIKHFYLRRSFRLFPPLLIVLCTAYLLVALGLLGGGMSVKAFIYQILYLANYFAIYTQVTDLIPAGTGILWSLAVEEHFYLFFPALLLIGLRKTSIKKIIIILCLFCLLILAWRLILVYGLDASSIRTYYATDTRIDSILYGCLLASYCNPFSDTSNMAVHKYIIPLVIISTLALLVTFIYREPVFRESFRYSIQGLALIPIFYFILKNQCPLLLKLTEQKWIKLIGIYSYTIYLVHFIVINLISRNFKHDLNPIFMLALTFSISMLIGFLIDKYIDSYFRTVRKKLKT